MSGFLGRLYASIGIDTTKLDIDSRKAKQMFSGIDASTRSLSSSLISLKGVLAGVGAAAAVMATKDLWNTQVMIDQMNRAFKNISGSAYGASKELTNIRSVASNLGQEFYSLSDSYKWLAAAAKDTSLEGKHARDIFLAVSEAGTALGLTNVQVKMSLYAISQMISKGTVNAEELRQQLGERLPGAYQAMARALGVSTRELNKMLEQGQIMATEALPKLAAELHRLYASDAALAADKPIGILNRFKTAWIDLKSEMGGSIFLQVATSSMIDLMNVFKDQEFKDALVEIVNNISILAGILGKIAVISFSSVTKSFADFLNTLKETPNPMTTVRKYGEAVEAIKELYQALQGNRSSYKSDRMSLIENAKRSIQQQESAIAQDLADVVNNPPPKKGKPEKFDYSLSAMGFYENAPSANRVNDPSQLARMWKDPIQEAKKYRMELDSIRDSQRKVQTTIAIYDANQMGATDMFMGLDAANERAKEMTDLAEDTFNIWAELSENTANKMENNFSNLLFDSLTGKFTSLADYAKAMFESIVRAWSDMTGQMLAQGLFSQNFGGLNLSGIFGGLFGGGSNSINYSPDALTGSSQMAFANGGYIGESIIGRGKRSGQSYEFHPNEFVIPADKLGGGGGGVQVIVNEAPQGTNVRQQQQGDITKIMIDVAASDVAGHGNLARAMESVYGINRVGRRS